MDLFYRADGLVNAVFPSQARAQDNGMGTPTAPIQIIMNGTVIREEADVDRVAQKLVEKVNGAHLPHV